MCSKNMSAMGLNIVPAAVSESSNFSFEVYVTSHWGGGRNFIFRLPELQENFRKKTIVFKVLFR